jgi:DNA-binding beta-propeller fold protein YncE
MNKTLFNFKNFMLCLILSMFSSLCYAVPFLIVPQAGVNLPTQIVQGSKASAFYTVTNITNRFLPGAFVKYLQANTTQVTIDNSVPNLCGATFNLQSNQSCTLELSVTGAIIAGDPDPHHNLFVCSPNVPACAGTGYPLNVTLSSQVTPPGVKLVSITVTPANVRNGAGTSNQFAATANYSDGTTATVTNLVNWTSSNTAVATIASTGLTTNVGAGVITISATLNSVTGSTGLDILQQHIYITNNIGTVVICPLNSNGSLATCTSFADASLSTPKDMVINPTYTLSYIVNSANNTISICPVNADGSLSACTIVTDSTFHAIAGITMDTAGANIFVTNNSTSTVSACPLNANGSLQACTATTGGGSFSNPTGIAMNFAKSYVYSTNLGGGNVTFCAINSNGSIGTCGFTVGGFSSPIDLAINTSFPYVYVTNNTFSTTHNINICTINNDGTLSASCPANTASTAVLNAPSGIGINGANTTVYIANTGNNNLLLCPVISSGSDLGTCVATTPSIALDSPYSAYVH